MCIKILETFALEQCHFRSSTIVSPETDPILPGSLVPTLQIKLKPKPQILLHPTFCILSKYVAHREESPLSLKSPGNASSFLPPATQGPYLAPAT